MSKLNFPNGLFCVLLDVKRIVIEKASRVNVCLFSVCYISDWILFRRHAFWTPRLLQSRKELLTQIGIVGAPRRQGLISLLSPLLFHKSSANRICDDRGRLHLLAEVGVFGGYQSTMRSCICKSNCCAANNFTAKAFFPPSLSRSLPALQLWKLPQIQTFILPDFLASSLQDSDNTISVCVFFRCWETNWIMSRSLHKQLSKRRQLF